MRGRGFLFPDAKLPELKAAYDSGLSVDKVAEQFKCARMTARNSLKRAGVKFRHPGHKRLAPGEAPKHLRRFQDHGEAQERVIHLPRSHAAIVGKTSVYANRVVDAVKPERLLKSGVHSRKIGERVVKGALWGMPIYTLTLEERRTCPQTCHHLHTCYGNSMSWAERLRPGVDLETRLEHELWLLARRHRGGFLVRLHVLGDFYGRDYVLGWRDWLRRFPPLHCFGYSAWAPGTEIGDALAGVVAEFWPRFAIRLSVPAERPSAWPLAVTAWTVPEGPRYGAAIVCPAQTGKTECCGTCALCWSTTKPIAFVMH